MHRLVLAALVVAAPARADVVNAPLTVHARLDGTTAAIAVRYAVDVTTGFQTDFDALEIPTHGIVTGAVVTVDGWVHRLALDPAEQATAKLTAIGEQPGGDDRAWAVDISTDGAPADHVQVEIAAPHPARLLIDLEIAAPTCFSRDVRYVLVPASWQSMFDATLQPRDVNAVDAACQSSSSDAMKWIGFPSRELAALPFGDQRIGTIGSRLALDTAHVARVELDLAREISHVPLDLHTAIVVDGSRSVSAAQRADQQAIVEAYLRAAPHGQVQLVEYDRNAHALLPAWTTASEAAARVTRALAAITPRNGSNLDRGLAEAARWLARTGGTRRIVVFSDELVAGRLAELPAAALQALLPAGTLVHVVALDGSGGSLDRDDTALFASLASATEGIAVHGSTDGDGHVDATKLVRPIALEQIAVQSPGWEASNGPLNDACPFDSHGDLAEGSSCSWWGIGDAVAGPIRIEGLVWGHRFVRVVRPDPSQGRSLARTLSATGSGLSEELMHQIDRAALAVNAAWSLFGAWAGYDGYADLGHGGGGWGTGGCACGDRGSFGSSGYGSLGPGPIGIPLKEQLARGIDRCAPGDARFDVSVELTFDEIVDVAVTMHAGSPALRACIEEAVWDTEAMMPGGSQHATFTIAFGA